MRQKQLEFVYMRGVAIMLIVAGHSIYNSEEGFPAFLENLIRGGTALFVFISGYFFHRVFYSRFEFRRFMSNKIDNVLWPFLLVSAVGLLALVPHWLWVEHHSVQQLPLDVWYTVRNGYVLYPHWYIPFILLIFVLSPLFLAYIRLTASARWFWLLIVSVLALIVQRPIGNVNVLQSALYFSPFYLLGICYSQDDTVLARYKQQIGWLSWGLLLLTLVMQTYVEGHLGNYHKNFWEFNNGFDWQFLQKVALCVLVLQGCEWLAQQGEQLWLTRLADMSFAIFFLHPLFSLAIGDVSYFIHFKLAPGSALTSILYSTLIFGIQLGGSVLVALWIKHKLGERSRSIIGW
ncbi:acyltransferase [Shewanella avicenniae]|uniref:Acyltransferase n=1 Tax=Shewanella avicenniae TaxID=2814294 RepID=A0ABX7QPI8_9GAMM|nr:acyltransferase [Shewanella avicenniae]QSX33391.1 acyltransferase [Shewanella avicenniae]